MSDADATRRLLALLGRQVEALQGFLAALDTERAALVARDADALAAAAAAKAESMATVEALERDRRGLAPNLAAMEAFAAAERGIAERWERLLDLTRRCRELNEANGRVIRRQRARVDGALGLLRGEPRQGSGLYGPDGERRGPGQRTPLASA